MNPMLRWAAAALAMASAGSALAECDAGTGACTFEVTSTLDRVDDNPGDGICRATIVASPPQVTRCTLRAAVMEANARELLGAADNGPYTIMLRAGETYPLSIAPGGSVSSADGDLDIRAPGIRILSDSPTGSRAILAPGPGYTGSAFRLGNTGNQVSADSFVLEGVTIRDFSPQTPDGSVVECVVGNDMTFRNVRLENNRLIDKPGAPLKLRSDCWITIYDSAFIGNENVRTGSGDHGAGGAIQVLGQGELSVYRTSFVGNTAQWGGALNLQEQAWAYLASVTIASNAVEGTSAAVHLTGSSQLRINNATIARNAGGAGIRGGNDGLMIKMANSVVVENETHDLFVAANATFTSEGHNRVGTFGAGSAVTTLTGVGDSLLQDAGFGPTIESVGRFAIPVLAPTPSSPLIDAGTPHGLANATGCSPVDAGDRTRNPGGRCDIGAVERFPDEWIFDALQVVDAADSEHGDGVCAAVQGDPDTCTLRAALEEAVALAEGGHTGPFTLRMVQGDHVISLSAAANDEQGLPIEVGSSIQVNIIAMPASTQRPRVRVAFPDAEDAIELQDGSSLHIRGVDFVAPPSGWTSAGRMLRCTSGSALTLEDVRIRDQYGADRVDVKDCTLTIKDSQFTGNSCADGFAGSVAVSAFASKVTIERSEFTNNTCMEAASVGALNLENSDVLIRNSTISGNIGGTSALTVRSGSAALQNTTIFDNRCTESDGSETGCAGGLNAENAVSLSLSSSIVSGNQNEEDYCFVANVVGGSTGGNVIGISNPDCTAMTLQPTDTSAPDPNLGALTTLGTHTYLRGHVPQFGGAAHDHVGGSYSNDPASGLCTQFDQASRDRGTSGADGICDAGAVERFGSAPPPGDPNAIFSSRFEAGENGQP